MLTNKEELQIKKLLKSFTCGSFNSFIPGTNIEFEPQGCNVFKINSNGGGSGGTTETVTFEELYTLYNGGNLVPNQRYRFEFESIYDQAITEVTKTGTSEWLIVTAMTSSQLYPVAFSETHPTDIIHYDITSITTFINVAPTKGKIIYRKDINENEACFDFRNVYMWDAVDNEERLFFNSNYSYFGNKLGNSEAHYNHLLFGGYEFTNSSVRKEMTHCQNNLWVNSHVVEDAVFVSGCIIADVRAGKDIAKIDTTNFYQVTFADSIDRMLGGFILFSAFGAQVQYLDNASFEFVTIDGDVFGISDVEIRNTDINCNIHNVTGMSGYPAGCGFNNVTIVGDTVASTIGNLTLEGLIEGVTITEASHPVLFSGLHKTLRENDNGEFWYSYYNNSNVETFIQII